MTSEMISVFVGESRDGYIKLTTDRDCLSCEIIRFDERLVPSEQLNERLIACKDAYEERGFKVCIDTPAMFYETLEKADIRKGLRFKHSRVLDSRLYDGKTMQTYQVTALRHGCVYYRPVYDYETRETLGKPEYCTVEQFSRVCKEVL